MFDANMRHLPKGHRFFAEMCGVREDHPIRQLDLKSRLVLCEMLSDDNENPTVRFYCDNSFIDMTDNECGIASWFVYTGNEDGSGFINDIKMKKSMEQLKT